MSQLDIFDDVPSRRLPRARRSDADGSHMAADALERSGRAAQQLGAVLEAVQRHSGSTSRELAALTGLDRYLVARRLPELQAHGLIDRVAIPGEQIRWWKRA